MKHKSLIKKFGYFTFVFFIFFYQIGFSQNEKIIDRKPKPDHVISSKITKKDYQLYISFPNEYFQNDSIYYPVLYNLDGELAFQVFHGTRIALDMAKEIENVIIVGVGSGTDKESWIINRWTDYLPFEDKVIDSLYAPEGAKSGGAQFFLESLKKEIIPFVEKNYRTNKKRGISGNSSGALFVSYCLFNATDIFEKFGINSPSLWWKENEMLRYEESFAKKNNVLNAKVFISVGSLEGETMVPQITKFYYDIKSRNYKGLGLNWQTFQNETHSSVLPASISRMLRTLYGVNNNQQ